MFDTFIQLAEVFISIFRLPVMAVFIFIGYYVVAVFFWYFLRWCRGDRVQRGSVRRLRQPSVLRRLLWDAPRRYVDDMYKRQPDFFRPQGLIIFTGRQGNEIGRAHV